MKYKISFHNPMPGMVPPYVIERRELWRGWVHVTRVNDPAEFESAAARDAEHRAFQSRVIDVRPTP